MMQTYYTPGVYVGHILTEPKRVLRTGVPVFLGLIRRQDLPDKFIQKEIDAPSQASIARKEGYTRLPVRPAPPQEEQRYGDSLSPAPQFYMRAVSGEQPPEPREVAEILRTGGAAGPPETAQRPLEKPQALSDKPQRFTAWPQFEETYGVLKPLGFLTDAVHGFFENGGLLCYVQVIAYDEDARLAALQAGLKTLEASSDYDLVCVPDIMWLQPPASEALSAETVEMQSEVIRHCEATGDRFAILDSLPQIMPEEVQRQREGLSGENAALYYPWVRVKEGPGKTDRYVPPCGHIAGVIARTDQAIGVHKAPANELLEGVLDLAVVLDDENQAPLNEDGINCLRAFPRRGIRVWGARTLSHQSAWRYVNVRRIFITAARWIERNMTDVVFEPNTPDLWPRIVRDLTAYFTDLLEQGALAGRSAREAFYVKCDAETNPPELRETGVVVTEIGLAPDSPAEFIVVRIMHGQTGVRIITPA
jgi:hypothetical protein